jgi:hypothetical protein
MGSDVLFDCELGSGGHDGVNDQPDTQPPVTRVI